MRRSGTRDSWLSRACGPVLIVLLILGQGASWAGGAGSLAHALDHDNAGSAAAHPEQHHHASHGGVTFPASGAPMDVEHNLLHEMEHLQWVPLSVAARQVPFEAALISVIAAVLPARRRPERRFRPPRAAA